MAKQENHDATAGENKPEKTLKWHRNCCAAAALGRWRTKHFVSKCEDASKNASIYYNYRQYCYLSYISQNCSNHSSVQELTLEPYFARQFAMQPNSKPTNYYR